MTRNGVVPDLTDRRPGNLDAVLTDLAGGSGASYVAPENTGCQTLSGTDEAVLLIPDEFRITEGNRSLGTITVERRERDPVLDT
ncbi:hypothetical protein [Halostella salina]|uniref:hypothetical protein n=1 Tax=Halostella salina TaxID=1547897 RepID=UPI0013CEC009|nr:hypothetical protein [Halostella salina]